MGMALEKKMGDDRPPGLRDGEGKSAQGLLEQAHRLAGQIEALLQDVGREVTESDNFRVRLARAHTLSLLDQLAELLGARASLPTPGVRNCSPRDEDDGGAASGVRPGSRSLYAR
jgi:hypothetical protein